MASRATRESFGRDWDAVIERWAMGGPINITAQHGWDALGALERLAPERLDSYYERGPSAGNIEFSQLLAFGSDLVVCEKLENLDRILSRIRHQERGAIVELEVLAFAVRAGLAPVIEPELQGRVLDFAVDSGGQRVFVETIGPSWSDAAASLLDNLNAAANTLFPAVGPDDRLQVGFVDDPTEPVVAEVQRHIARLKRSAGVEAIDDLALVRLDPLDAQVEGIDLGPGPAIGCARFESNDDYTRILNVTAAFSDERIERLIASELHHFSRALPNILVVHVGAVAGALPGWEPLIRRVFQPSRNTRLGAVMLLERLYEGVVVPGAHRGRVLENPHAIKPVPSALVDALSRHLRGG